MEDSVSKREFEKAFEQAKKNFAEKGETEILPYLDAWKEFFYGFFMAGLGTATLHYNKAIEDTVRAVNKVNKNLSEGKDANDDIEIV